jgi:mRNA-degrading endonuclease toxin of MazEF toxin-antitoxin module
MPNVTRGSLYLVKLSNGARTPVLVVSRNALHQESDFALVASGTGTDLDDEGVILCELIRPVNKQHFHTLIGQIQENLQSKVDNSLQVVLALD